MSDLTPPLPPPAFVLAGYDALDQNGRAAVYVWLRLDPPDVRTHYREGPAWDTGLFRSVQPDQFDHYELRLQAKTLGLTVAPSLPEAWAKLPNLVSTWPGLPEGTATALTSVLQPRRPGGNPMVLRPHLDKIVARMRQEDGDAADRTSPEQYRAWATAVLDAADLEGLTLTEAVTEPQG